ncbi:Y-family DNA polymerase [Cupriavidus basilensis]
MGRSRGQPWTSTARFRGGSLRSAARIIRRWSNPSPSMRPYLDVSECPHHDGSATRIAEEIRRRVRGEVGVTVSAGVGPNKLRWARLPATGTSPTGSSWCGLEPWSAFVAELPVGRIHGVGAVTAAKLWRLGAETRGDSSVEWHGCPAASLEVRQLRCAARLQPVPRYRPPHGIARARTQIDQRGGDLRRRPARLLQACPAELEPLIAMLEARIARARGA